MSIQVHFTTPVHPRPREALVAALGVALIGVAAGRLINLSETLTLALALLTGLIALAVAWRVKPTKQAASRLFVVGFAAAFIGILVRIYLTTTSG